MEAQSPRKAEPHRRTPSKPVTQRKLIMAKVYDKTILIVTK